MLLFNWKSMTLMSMQTKSKKHRRRRLEDTMTLSDGKYTFTVTEVCTFAAEFVKKTSGGAYRPNAGTDVTWYPSTNGVEKSWAEIAEDLGKMSSEDTIHISLNGQTIVPEDVIKAIRDNKLIIEFIVDGKKSRAVNGADIINTAETDFSMIAGSADKSTLRGTVGADIITGAICSHRPHCKTRHRKRGQIRKPLQICRRKTHVHRLR